MNYIVCLDLENGMLFNKRRQSQDREVRKDVKIISQKSRLWMNEYSFKQFKEDENDNINVCEDFLEKMSEEDFGLVENSDFSLKSGDKLIVYRWDKKYPSDKGLDINLDALKSVEESEITGYSHEIIKKEVYLYE